MNTAKQKLVMVGNGMAGVRTLEELFKLAPDAYEVTVLGAEPHPNYNRIMLSPVLCGEQTIDQIVLNSYDWYAQHQVALHVGQAVVNLDRRRRIVMRADGALFPYDRLLLATGSNPFVLPVVGHDLPGVVTFRDISDVETMIAAAKNYQHAVVIGGGLLGLEAANGLCQRGMHVSVVHLGARLLDRQLDQTAACLLQAQLEARGLHFLLQKQTAELVAGASGRVAAVRFQDGQSVAADLVVMAVGIRPNDALAAHAGLECARGIVVNDYLQTSDAAIYAVGECVSHRGVNYGLVAPLYDMAKVAAAHLAGISPAPYVPRPTATKLKISGIDLFSAGNFLGGDGCEEITLFDPVAALYKKLVIQEDCLVGACLYGDTNDGGEYFRWIREHYPIMQSREALLLGGEALSAMRGVITPAVADVASPHDLVPAMSTEPMCGCTAFSHAQVRAAIAAAPVVDGVRGVFKRLGWRNPQGCATCRPAVHYYSVSAWPAHTPQMVQAFNTDGYVLPDGEVDTFRLHCWGGVTTPAQLRRIADVADKYQLSIRVDEGPSLVLSAVKSEDRSRLWRELDLPEECGSENAPLSAVQVSSCVGGHLCQSGCQQAAQLARTVSNWAQTVLCPARLRVAVSACSHHCAEVVTKDIGLLGLAHGWVVYVGGHVGQHTMMADALVSVPTVAQALEYSAAFLQFYREQAFYQENTADFCQRIGLDRVRAQLLGCANQRMALYERLQFAQHCQQTQHKRASTAVRGQQAFGLSGGQ